MITETQIIGLLTRANCILIMAITVIIIRHYKTIKRWFINNFSIVKVMVGYGVTGKEGFEARMR